MSKKSPALSTRLSSIKATLDELEQKLKSAESSEDTWFRISQEREAELEQIHAFLVTVPNSIPRKTDAEESYNRRDVKH